MLVMLIDEDLLDLTVKLDIILESMTPKHWFLGHLVSYSITDMQNLEM